uniref:CUB domain-containing protein n=1 Tax=Caenorhabditis tropicalis TaxID=1561998 RepID=A0A1I7UGY6_9PELO
MGGAWLQKGGAYCQNSEANCRKRGRCEKNAIGVLEMYKKIIFDGAGGEYDALREEIRKLEETLFGTIKVIPSLQLNISHNPPIQTALFNTQWLLIASSNLDTYLNRNKKHSREAGKYKVLKFEMDSKEVPGDVPIVNELRTYHLDGTSFTRHFTHKNTGTMQFTEGVSYKLCYNFIKDNALVSRELSVCGKNRKENLEQVSRSFENGYLLIRNEIQGVKCSRKFVRIEF